MTAVAGAVTLDNALVVSQLTITISVQNKEAMESNNLRCKEIERKIEQEEKKKDQTKKVRPAIINMLQRATVTHKNDKTEGISPTCLLRFINFDNVGLAQYKLIHHFKEGGLPDVIFALGTTQALFLGLYAHSSTLSNFAVFAFSKQEPNSANQQTDFFICHLIQE
jgi:hypothetical protein